jgi:hypothetical protein
MARGDAGSRWSAMKPIAVLPGARSTKKNEKEVDDAHRE